MKKRILPLLTILLTIALFLSLDRALVTMWENGHKRSLGSEADTSSVRFREALCSKVNTTQFIKTLFALHPDTSEEEFAYLAEQLFQFQGALQAVQIADKSTQVIYVYPPKGNEITIKEPLLLVDDPKRGSYVRKAMESGETSIQPPFELRQGGIGIVARNPMFIDGSFQGLAIAVLDFSQIIHEAIPKYKEAVYQLRIVDEQQNPLYGGIEKAAYFERRSIQCADAQWYLDLAYQAESSGSHELVRVVILLLGAGLLALLLLTFRLSRTQAERLATEVHKRTEELEISENRFRGIIENSNAGYLCIDRRGKISRVNYAWLRIFGKEDPSEVLNQDINTFLNQGECQSSHLIQLMEKEESVDGEECRIQRPDGSNGYYLLSARPVIRNSILYALDCFFYDISEQKHTEEEKDYLMRELNHRVKNNLLMISSLVKLKNDSLGKAIDLSDIGHQIDAIRIVHEKLYLTGEIRQIHFRDYVQDLLQTIFSSFTHIPVTIDNRIQELSIRTKDSVTLGLIINEIATNAIKYGFRDDDTPQCFTVEMKENRNEQSYLLELSNTGNPFPEGIDFHNPQTLGLRLINVLVQQLDGVINIERRPLTRFVITIPLEQ